MTPALLRPHVDALEEALQPRLAARIDRSGGRGACWPWTGMRDEKGYGRVKVAGRTVHAHRVVYQDAVGPIPTGHVVRHDCDNPSCCNPNHLRAGTVAENQQDMAARGRSTRGRLRRDHALVQRVADLVAQGHSRRAVARMLGTSVTTIRDILRDPRLPGPGLTDSTADGLGAPGARGGGQARSEAPGVTAAPRSATARPLPPGGSAVAGSPCSGSPISARGGGSPDPFPARELAGASELHPLG